jgi:predicted ATPase
MVVTFPEIGDSYALHASVAAAFSGASVSVRSDGGWFDFEIQPHGLLRPLKAAELSNGTLRYAASSSTNVTFRITLYAVIFPLCT